MSSLGDFDRILRHIWSEPKFVAEVEYMNLPNHLSNQLAAQWPRTEMAHYIATGKHADPERTITFEAPPEPIDFDWWEPRYDQPWRRQAARDRG